MQNVPELSLDKNSLKIGATLEESIADEVEYWRNASVKERLQHIERLRRLNYGARATERLQRVIRIVECE